MSDQIQRRIFIFSAVTAWPAMIAGGDILHGRRLKRRCCLPHYNYESDRLVNPVSGNSTRGIAWLVDGSGAVNSDRADPDETREILKTFQLDRSELRVHHCRISRVVVIVTSTGEWTLSLTAEQNPLLVEDVAQRPQFERYRRNRFRVDVRPVGLFEVNPQIPQAHLAKPEFPFIEPQEFWVQKQQVAHVMRRGQSDYLRRYFHVIRQAEVHFSYAPLQQAAQNAVDIRQQRVIR